MAFKCGELLGVRCSLQSSADKFCWRHVQCAKSPMYLAESAASSGSSRLHSSMNFGSRN